MASEKRKQIAAKKKKLQEQLKQLEQDNESVLKKEMDEFVNQIKEEIKENDFELKAVIDLLQIELKGTNKKSSDRKTRKFKVLVDPDNPQNTYKTGPLTPWMKDKMKEQGLDPNKKEDVKEFKKKLNIQE